MTASMEGSDLCQEIVRRASSGFVYSEAVARYLSSSVSSFCCMQLSVIIRLYHCVNAHSEVRYLVSVG